MQSTKTAVVMNNIMRLAREVSVMEWRDYSILSFLSTKPVVDYLLTLNINNRKVKVTSWGRLARDMVAGNFLFTAQGISVDDSGILSDGQHRLVANKESDYPSVPLLAVLGVSRSAQAVVDQQAKRSMADVVGFLLNTTISTRLIASLNIIVHVPGLSKKGDAFKWGNRNDFSRSPLELQEMVLDWTEAAEIAAICDCSAAVIGTIASFARFFSLETAREFTESFKMGANLDEDSPVLRLRNALAKIKTKDSWGKMKIICLTASALKAFSEDKSIKMLKGIESW